MATGEYRIIVAVDLDVTRASMQARRCAMAQGFNATTTALLVTTVSELGTNILKYAARGEITIQAIEEGEKKGILIRALDHGPGIANIKAAMQDHHSTGGTLGLGLPGVKRMMDEFDIHSELKRGTSVTVKKWK
ncbi:MAG: ATP-binding protein [Pirellulales bacterium]